MYVKYTEKRQFEKEAYEGLAHYHKTKKRIEHLVLSKNPESSIDIFKCFELLIPRILNYSKYGRYQKIDFLLAMVNHQHLHILIKKPFIPHDVLKKYWGDITQYGNSLNLYVKTVKGDKSELKDMQRLVTYIMNQATEHETTDVIYIRTKKWGQTTKREKLNSSDVIQIPDIKRKKEEFPDYQDIKNMVRGPDGQWIKTDTS